MSGRFFFGVLSGAVLVSGAFVLGSVMFPIGKDAPPVEVANAPTAPDAAPTPAPEAAPEPRADAAPEAAAMDAPSAEPAPATAPDAVEATAPAPVPAPEPAPETAPESAAAASDTGATEADAGTAAVTGVTAATDPSAAASGQTVSPPTDSDQAAAPELIEPPAPAPEPAPAVSTTETAPASPPAPEPAAEVTPDGPATTEPATLPAQPAALEPPEVDGADLPSDAASAPAELAGDGSADLEPAATPEPAVDPSPNVSAVETPSLESATGTDAGPEATPAETAEAIPEPAPEPTPEQTAELAPEPTPEPADDSAPDATPEPASEPSPEPSEEPAGALQPDAGAGIAEAPEPAPAALPQDDGMGTDLPAPDAPALPGDEVAPLEPNAEALPGTAGLDPSDSTFESAPGLDGASEGVVINRLPRIGDAPAEEAPEPEAAETQPEPNTQPLVEFAASFENPDDKPTFAIVLIDPGTGDLDREGLAALPFPATFALDPLDPETPGRAAIYRSAGKEVVMLATGIAEGAQASDVEVAFQTMAQGLPEAVAVMDLADPTFQDRRSLASIVVPVVGAQGRGLLTWDQGLNAADQVARRDDVPAAVLFRDIGEAGTDTAAIRRLLDRAVFKAGQDGRVAVAGTATPETVAALLEWTVEGRAATVALAPLTAVLTVE